MIYELHDEVIYKVKLLFKGLMYQCFCGAVFEGIHPGRVFVDDRSHLSSAFMVTRGSWSYLAGEMNNPGFISSLNTALNSGELIDGEVSGLLISCTTPESYQLLVEICHPREPIPMPRLHYTCSEFNYEWLSGLPQGVNIQIITRRMLDEKQYELPDDVRSLIQSWGDGDLDDRKGFGFVALANGKIASRAVVDCVVGDVGEIGLETDPEFQRRGLATATSAAAIEYGLTKGLRQVVWDCYEHNIPSVRLAEKLGFTLERRHQMHFMMFDEFLHEYNLAWFSLEAQRYEKTIQVCRRIKEYREDIPSGVYYLDATALAGLGEDKTALIRLNEAIDGGWSGIDELLQVREWERLHSTPEWEDALNRLEGPGATVA